MYTNKKTGETYATTKKELLIAAKWILENHGWCKGESRDKLGRFCAFGAICHVNVIGFSYYDIKLFTVLDPKFAAITIYNDNPKTTYNDIMALFDAEIKACDNETR